jgi:hypothetical protein
MVSAMFIDFQLFYFLTRIIPDISIRQFDHAIYKGGISLSSTE